MAIYGNFKGTTKSDFKIGKNGAKIYGTPTRPSAGMVTGDLWVDSSNSTLQVYDSSNTWVSIGATLQDLNINDGQLAVDTGANVITANANVVVSRNVTADNFFGQLLGNVTGTVSSLGNQTTDTLAEGVINEYFTEDRARDALPAIDDVLYINKNGRDVFDGRSEARAFFTVSAAAESIGPPYKANMPEGSDVLPGEFNQAAQLLLANKEFIQNEVVEYVIQQESFRYDRAKCERDVGFIIDAVTYDLVLDTNYNSVTAGIAYQRGNATDVITDQVAETVAAFEFLRDLMIGFTTNPDTAARITASVGIITDIIQTNTVAPIVYNNPSTATNELIAAKDQLQNNRALIQQAVIDFVDTNFTGLQYNETKCRRDTGFIIDAITYDLVLNTNYNSITSGNAYRRGNAADVIGLQKVPTIGAFEFLRDEMVRIAATDYAQTRIPELFEDLIDIIDTDTVDQIFYTNPSTATQDVINAKDQLIANRALIQQSVVDYVDQVLGGYGDVKCFRDVGFIVDAITYDMVLDTNYNSVTAGLAYRRGNATDILGVQRTNTVAAFTFLRDEMINLTTSIEANLRITDLMQNILDAINVGTTDPIVYNDPATAEQDKINAKNQLQDNRSLIANAVVQFVNDNFTYDQAKCFRDVGFVIDAVIYDMVLETNYNSITAGLAYRGANAADVLGPQKEATIAAFNHLRNLMIALTNTPAATQRITEAFVDIIDIIDTNTVDTVVYNEPAGLGQDFIDAKDQLQNNRGLIQNAVVDFINLQFSYDREKCARDVGFIIDAVTYDMVLDTNYNSVTAGLAYIGGNATDVLTFQRQPTIDAFNFLRDQMIAVTTSATAAARITDLIQDVTDAIDTQTIDTIFYNVPLSATDAEVNAHVQLRNNRDLIANAVVEFVNENFTYDQVKCFRDVGFIVDAVTFDMVLNTNYNSITAGLSYRGGNALDVLGPQKEATIAAFEFLRDEMNALAGDLAVQTTIAARIQDITDIIDTNTVDPIVFNDPSTASVNEVNAKNQLQNNRALIQSEVVDFVNLNYPVLDYDANLCFRDVGYIVDALTFDVLYGGNFASRAAASIYFVGSNVQLGVGESTATIAAYNELQNIVSNVVQETYPGQDTSADPASAAEASFLTSRVQLVIDVITDGNTDNLPAVLSPDISAGTILEQIDYSAITAEKGNLQTATVDFIGTNGFDFINGYDANLCLRDTGYIIDALSHDILYDGNFASRQAAQIYFTQTIFGLENELDKRNESNATIAAFTELGNIASSVVQGTYPGQDVTAGIATVNEATELQNLAGITADALKEGDPDQIVQLEAPDLLAGNVELRNDYANIIAIQGDLQTATVANVDASNSFLVYNQDLCFRDVGYIVDALSHDILYDGNFASLQVAGIYFAGAVNQLGSQDETNATIAAYTELGNVVSDVVVGTFPGQDSTAGNASLVQQNILQNLIQITTDVLTSGDGNTLPAVVAPDTSVAPIGLQDDLTAIQAQKESLQAETVGFVNTQTYLVNGYDANACLRDVGFIVDGLTHDILYDGNFASRLVADAYFVGAMSQIGFNEDQATIAAYNLLQDVASNVVLGTYPGQSNTFGTASQVEADQLTELLQITIDAISIMKVSEIPALEAPNVAIANVELLSDYGNIVFEKANLQQATLDQVNSNTSIFPYDSAACFRDTGFIVDALAHDILYDGNFASRQVAEAYFVGANVQLGSSDEVNATIQAYQEMQLIVGNVIQGAFPGQDTTSGNATIAEAISAADLLQITIDTITAGDTSGIPALEAPNVSAANAAVQSDRSNILADANVLTDGTILYVDNNFVEFTYNQEKCFRDVRFIVEAVTLDMVLDTNYNSVTAGNAYRRGNASDVLGSQQPQTIQAYEFLRDTMTGLVTSETAQLRINAAFGDIIDIVSDNTVDTIYYNAAPGIPEELVNAQQQLRNNRELIQNAVIDFVNSNFTYNKAKCGRDVGFIIDAVIYDMTTNSNYNSVTAGLSYLGGNARDVLQFQRPETVQAFNNLRDLMVGIAEDATSQARIVDLFQDITDVLETGTVDTIRFNNPPSQQQDIIDAKNQLQDNRAIIQQAVVDFVNSNFSYNEAKCFRDTGFIIDAVIYDMVLETNHNVLAAGKAYRGGNATLVIDTQRTQTVAAFNFLRDQMLAVTTDPVSASRITALFQDLTDIIDTNTVDDLFFDSPAGADQDVIDAKNLLQDNKTLIQESVVDFVNDNFSYDETKCRRDTGFVIDAVLYDMLLDTNYNSVTAGLAYQRGNATDVLGFQNETTIEAFTFLRDEMLTLAQNDTANIRIAAAFDDILDSLSTNTIDTIFYNDPATADANVVNAKNQLQNNRDLIANTVVEFVNQNFTYDEAKCFRDVGFIIDAVLYDMLLDTNYNSVTAGLLYNGGNATDVLGPQKAATIAAFEFLRDEMIAIANDTQADSRITAAFVDVIDAIDTNTIDAIVYNAPAGVDQDRVDAFEQLQNNRGLIQANVVNFVDTNFANLTYDANACSRDVGYIVDALSHDILYDGNFASRQVATAYFVGTQSQLGSIDETTATIAAYGYLQGVVSNIVLETFPGQDTSAGIASSALASDLGNLVQISVDVLTAGGLATIDPLVQPNVLVANATLQSDFANINTVKGNLQTSTVEFVNNQSFFINDYDQDLCLRDVGFIVDGLTHDILYGGNYASRLLADAYFVGVTSQLGMGESTATVAAYNELQNVISSVVVETFPGQDATANAATVAEANELANLLQITIDLIESNNTTQLPALVEPDTTIATVPVQNTQLLINAERANLTNAVIGVVEANASFLIYDSNACFRDTGFLVDALSHDILYGGNFATRTAGLTYFVGTDVQIGRGESNATIQAYGELGRIAGAVVLTTFPGQTVNFNPATQTEADRLANLTAIVADVIATSDPGNIALLEQPDLTVGRPVGIQQDFANIAAQRTPLQEATVGFVNDTFDFISYDANLCFRDVGYIVDAATFDLLYDGNYASRLAANSYFVASVNQLGDGETNATIAAYNELQSITSQVVQGLYPGQVLDSQVATSVEADRVNALVQVTIDVLQDGDVSNLAFLEEPNVLISGISVRSDLQALQAQRTLLQDTTLNFVDNNFKFIEYDEALCFRDVGFIVDSLAHDVQYGGTFAATQVAFSYFVGVNESQLGPDEVNATVAAYTELGEIAGQVIQGTFPGQDTTAGVATEIQANAIVDLLSITTDTIAAGTTDVIPFPAQFPDLTVANVELQNAYAVLEPETANLQQQTIDFINDLYGGFSYNQDLCFRDVGFIVDGISHDVLYGGNFAARLIADSYFVGVTSQLGSVGEIDATVAAYQELQNITANVVTENFPGQDITANAATTNEANVIADLLQVTIDVVREGNTSSIPVLVSPDITAANIEIQNDYGNIVAERGNLQIEIIDFVDQTYPRLMTDRQTNLCFRDTGFIVDALAEDLVRGGNQFASACGVAYFNGSASRLPADQLQPTQNAISLIATIASDAMYNRPVGITYQTEVPQVFDDGILPEPGANVNVDTLVAGINETIVNPTFSRGAIIKNNIEIEGELNPGAYENAATLLDLNKAFIQSEARAFGNVNFGGSLGEDNLDKTFRDTGFIIDAVVEDLRKGGARRTSIVATEFWDSESKPKIRPEIQGNCVSILNYVNTVAGSVIENSLRIPLQNDVTQIIDGSLPLEPGSDVAMTALIDSVPRTIQNPKIAAQKQVVSNFNGLAANNPGSFDNAAQLLLANRAFIQEEVIARTNATESFQYDRNKCSRDVGLIIQAVALDLALGTNYNSVTAGIAYLRSASDYVRSAQFTQTIQAIEFVRDYIVTDLAIDDQTKDIVRQRFEDLLDIVQERLFDNLFFEQPDNAGEDRISAAFLLEKNRDFMQTEVMNFIAREYTGLRFNERTCRRDVGFIVDGLVHDVLYGGNYASRIVADSYYNGTMAQIGRQEFPATIDSYWFLRDMANQIIQGQYNGQQLLNSRELGGPAEVDRITELLQITIDVIRLRGTDSIPDIQLPDLTWNNEPFLSDYATIIAATPVIQNNTLTFVDNNLGQLLYNQDLCKRDVGHIVDALVEDLQTGGYEECKIAALDYYSGAATVLPQDQFGPTTNAISYIATLASDVVFNQTVANTFQANVSQVIDSEFQGEPDSADNIAFLVGGINDTIREAKPRRVVLMVQAGDYTVENPVKLPPNTAVWGNGIRTTSIRPRITNQDVFYVDNGCYIGEMTLRDHVAPSAAVAFDPTLRDTLRPIISTSPYIQNATSRTTTGTGLRIDGASVRGDIRSMVCDSYTQFNEGGIGVRILNQGYAQLVSVFTICCNDGFVCESGAVTSITNSNSSFGTRALRSTGTSPLLYAGELGATVNTGKNIIIRNLPQKPNVSDAVLIDGANAYFTVFNTTQIDETTWNVRLIESIVSEEFTEGTRVRFYQRSLIVASSHTFEFVGAGDILRNALPSFGGIPNPEGEGVFDENNAGKVFYTSTNENGDFSVSGEFVINQNTGTVTGRTFDKSLFAVLTPYILALQN